MNAKVANFGIDNQVYLRAEGSQLSVSNKYKSFFRWAAYETLKNEIAIREKSNVWSFGIFMWELFNLCDALPYADIKGKLLHDYLF